MRRKCPACKKEVPAEATACPFCPMSFEQPAQGLSPAERYGTPSLPLWAWLTATLLLGWGAWQALTYVMEHANGERASPAARGPKGRQTPTKEEPRYISVTPAEPQVPAQK